MPTFEENSPEHVGAYNLGAFAYLDGKPLSSNPHPFDSPLEAAWRDGWLDEAGSAQREA